MRVSKRKIKQLLKQGPQSFENLSQSIYGCECSNKVTEREHEEVASLIREMHDNGEVGYTIDRKVALVEE